MFREKLPSWFDLQVSHSVRYTTPHPLSTPLLRAWATIAIKTKWHSKWSFGLRRKNVTDRDTMRETETTAFQRIMSYALCIAFFWHSYSFCYVMFSFVCFFSPSITESRVKLRSTILSNFTLGSPHSFLTDRQIYHGKGLREIIYPKVSILRNNEETAWKETNISRTPLWNSFYHSRSVDLNIYRYLTVIHILNESIEHTWKKNEILSCYWSGQWLIKSFWRTWNKSAICKSHSVTVQMVDSFSLLSDA